MDITEPEPHIMAKLHLFPTAEAGRAEPTPPDAFSGLVGWNGRYHAIRFDLSSVGSLAPGATTAAPIPARFQLPQFILPYLRIGDTFMVRENRVVGQAVVTEILVRMQPRDAHPDNDAPQMTVTASDGWVLCPCCGKQFKLADAKRWNGERHMTCGQRLAVDAA